MNNQNKIIFLDIDGVLNGYNRWNLIGWKIVSKIKYKPLELWYKRITEPFGVHESKVKRLAKIVNKTGAKIVMSSSWRHGWWNTPYERQYDDQRRLTDLFNKYNLEVMSITPTLKSGRRGDEIAQWLHANKYEVISFIILDDENFDMSPFDTSPNFIQTSNGKFSGLKNKHVSWAIKQLNSY